jgi:hypothetical protein
MLQRRALTRRPARNQKADSIGNLPANQRPQPVLVEALAALSGQGA